MIEVRDDGKGGADPRAGSGLAGIADRVAALDGRLVIDSPPGAGTVLRAEFPAPLSAADGDGHERVLGQAGRRGELTAPDAGRGSGPEAPAIPQTAINIRKLRTSCDRRPPAETT